MFFARLALNAELDNVALRMLELEALEERRDKAKNLSIYQRRLSRAYNKLVKMRKFEEGDLALLATEHIRRGTLTFKFNLKWEGLYILYKYSKIHLLSYKCSPYTSHIKTEHINHENQL